MIQKGYGQQIVVIEINYLYHQNILRIFLCSVSSILMSVCVFDLNTIKMKVGITSFLVLPEAFVWLSR